MMILILGGLASGKRTFAEHVLGYSPAQMSDGVLNNLPLLYNLQNLVAADPEHAPDLLDALLKKEVVIVNEVGSGLIPMDPRERLVREATGRLTIRLAQKADTVIRMVAGLPQVIKGSL